MDTDQCLLLTNKILGTVDSGKVSNMTNKIAHDSYLNITQQKLIVYSPIFHQETIHNGLPRNHVFQFLQNSSPVAANCRILEKQLSVLNVELMKEQLIIQNIIIKTKEVMEIKEQLERELHRQKSKLSEASDKLEKLICLKKQICFCYSDIKSERKHLNFHVDQMLYDNGTMSSFLKNLQDKREESDNDDDDDNKLLSEATIVGGSNTRCPSFCAILSHWRRYSFGFSKEVYSGTAAAGAATAARMDCFSPKKNDANVIEKGSMLGAVYGELSLIHI